MKKVSRKPKRPQIRNPKSAVRNRPKLPAPSDTERQYEGTHHYRTFLIVDLRTAMEAVLSADNPDGPWEAVVPKADVAALRAAAAYFHADTPHVAADGGRTVTMVGKDR